MKNKSQTIFISFTLLGIVLCIIAYMYYYSPTKTKTAQLKGSNKTLAERVAVLEEFYKEMPENQERIQEWTESIQKSLADFPADVKSEDMIYLALRTMKLDALKERYADGSIKEEDKLILGNTLDNQGLLVGYTGITLGEREELATVSQDVVKKAQIEGLDQELYFFKRTAEYINMTEYANMKCLVQSINTETDKMNISNIAYSVDEESGLLNGTVTVTFYGATGTGSAYEPKSFKEYPTGLQNLFGIVK